MWITNIELEKRISEIEKKIIQNNEPTTWQYKWQIWFDEVEWVLKYWDWFKYINSWWWWWWWWWWKYCFATLSDNETTTNWTSKTLTLNTFDTNDSWMSITNWRITITKNWLYHLSWCVTFVTNPTWLRELLLRKNWITNTNIHYTVNPTSWWDTSCVFSRYYNFVVWDYIEVRAFQTSWWYLDVTNNTQKTFIQLIEII